MACQVKNCSNYPRKKTDVSVQFFRFPRDDERREKWREASGRDKINVVDARICSIHFEKKCFKKSWIEETYNIKSKRDRKLKNDAVPTLYLPPKSESVSSPNGCIEDLSLIKCEESSEPIVLDQIYTNTVNETDSQPGNFIFVKCENSSESIASYQTCATSPTQSHIQPEASTEISSSGKGVKRVASYETFEFEHAVKELKCDYEKKLANEIQKRIQLEEALKAEQEKNVQLQRLLQQGISKSEVEGRLSRMFTPAQIKAVMNPETQKIIWTKEDIVAAMSACRYGLASYEYWRQTRHIPMPAPSTLRKWTERVSFQPGTLKSVLKHMGHKSREMSEFSRLTVISFNEVNLLFQAHIDGHKDQMVGPHKTAHFCMSRGLFGRWKSAVYYDYAKPMSKESLFPIIEDLYDEGYTVTTIVCDLGPSNEEVWTSLDIGIEPDQLRYFPHPRNSSLRVYVSIDGPQLLKLIRDHFIDSGFIINGSLITTESINFIANLPDPLDLKIVPSLLQKLLTVENTERHNVKWAAKLFSNTVATAIRSLGKRGCLGDDPYWKETADFIELVNDWFDICNANNKYGPHKKAHAYGINLEYQNEILDRMSATMRQLRLIPKCTNTQQSTKERKQTTLMPFQHGLILSCLSLKELLVYLKENYTGIEYILTRRLHQEICEQILPGTESDGPTALNFQYRMRSFILGKHTGDALNITSGLESEDENLTDDYVPTEAELGKHCDILQDDEFSGDQLGDVKP